MWNWINCYLSGRHEYGVWCKPGEIYLRCVHCGRRSPGWNLGGEHEHVHAPDAHAAGVRRLNPTAFVPASRPNAR
jgi:hypothetical protein